MVSKEQHSKAVDLEINKKDFLLDVVKRYDHYIATTNFKVALLMSFLVAVIFGLTTRFVTLEEITGSSSIYLALTTFSILTILTACFSIYLLIKVVFPNTESPHTGNSLIFYGDVASSYSEAKDYLKQINRASDQEILEDLANQTFIVASITDKKFKALKTASSTVMFAVIPLLTVSLVLTLLIGN